MNFFNRIKNYRFEVYHFIILIIIVITSQVLLSYLNMSSAEDILQKSMEIYKLETAERQSDFTTSSIELLIQNYIESSEKFQNKIQLLESIDFLIHQELLQKNVEDICFLVYKNSECYILDKGKDIYNYLLNNGKEKIQNSNKRTSVKEYFFNAMEDIYEKESIKSFIENDKIFHVFVPFFIKGEVVGAVYQKITPDVADMSAVINSSLGTTGAWVSAIILLGILFVFIFTNYVVTERDKAQAELFEQREQQLTQLIESRKEAGFARRIYHTHHKAEKIVGFIKSDLLNINESNVTQIAQKVKRYANFIGRVIYDMKTYNPPINVIRNTQFRTNINEVINFLITNVIKRTYTSDDSINIICKLADNFPIQNINEYVVWEILEPLIQNSLEHNKDNEITITVKTIAEIKNNRIEISDNGKGFKEFLLQPDETGIKEIFKEKISTKDEKINSGYGCYIAYENCKRCGWKIDAVNTEVGAKFIINLF